MKEEILNTALANLKKSTAIKAKKGKRKSLDGLIYLLIDNEEIELIAIVKRELRLHQLQAIKDYYKTNKNIIIVAENIFPKIKVQLREIGVAYLETNGNLFLKTNKKYILIDTNKKSKVKKERSNRAFTKTGLKVLFQFLIKPHLINKTYREIANEANVGLGSIPQIINGLKATNYLIEVENKNYIWNNQEELINRWINYYVTELRPKLIIGKYKIPKQWKDLKLNKAMSVWGGEPAGDILTNYLRPETFILYTKESKVNLIKNYKLMPKEDGELEILEMFWKKNDESITAPPLLVYAELMIVGGKRNEEIAKKILNEYIKPNLQRVSHTIL